MKSSTWITQWFLTSEMLNGDSHFEDRESLHAEQPFIIGEELFEAQPIIGSCTASHKFGWTRISHVLTPFLREQPCVASPAVPVLTLTNQKHLQML